jgi:hypothetical protein
MHVTIMALELAVIIIFLMNEGTDLCSNLFTFKQSSWASPSYSEDEEDKP